MGNDCGLITEKGKTFLDRFYVFSCYGEEGCIKDCKEYTKKDFISLLENCKKYAKDYWKEDEDKEKLDYCLYWIKIAEENSGERNIIISESNSESISFHESKNIDNLITYYGEKV